MYWLGLVWSAGWERVPWPGDLPFPQTGPCWTGYTLSSLPQTGPAQTGPGQDVPYLPSPLPCEQKDRHVWKYYLPAWLVKYLTLSMMWTTDYCPRVKYIIAIKKFHVYEVFIMKSLWDPLHIHSQIWFTNVAYHIHRRFLFFKVLYMEF